MAGGKDKWWNWWDVTGLVGCVVVLGAVVYKVYKGNKAVEEDLEAQQKEIAKLGRSRRARARRWALTERKRREKRGESPDWILEAYMKPNAKKKKKKKGRKKRS